MAKRRSEWKKKTNNFSEFYVKKRSLDEIVRENIEKNFDEFYSPSNGHFKGFFYIRDFWWVVDSLKKLGYEDYAKKTLNFVLNQYQKHKKITTTVTKDDVFDYPNYGMDSLPCLIDSIRILDYKLSDFQVKFIKKELDKYYKNIENKMVTPKKHFSNLSDHKIRRSSTYSNSMYYLLLKALDELNEKYGYGLKLKDNPEEVKNAILSRLYNKKEGYFYDDIQKKPFVSGDAQIFPFRVGMIDDVEMFKKAIKNIYKNKLNEKLALRYHNPELFQNYNIFEHLKNVITNPKNQPQYHFSSLLCHEYQTDPYWGLLGINYLDALMKMHQKTHDDFIFNELKKETIRWKELIEKYGDMFELYQENKDRKKIRFIYEKDHNEYEIKEEIPELIPFKTSTYFADDGMIWQAKILEAYNYIKNYDSNIDNDVKQKKYENTIIVKKAQK